MDEIDFEHLEPLEPLRDAVGGGVAVVVSRDMLAGSRLYRLLVPLTVESGGRRRRVKQVLLRLPSQGEIDAWGRGEIAGRRALMCHLTGEPAEVIAALAWPDSEALHQMLADMLPSFVTGAEE